MGLLSKAREKKDNTSSVIPKFNTSPISNTSKLNKVELPKPVMDEESFGPKDSELNFLNDSNENLMPPQPPEPPMPPEAPLPPEPPMPPISSMSTDTKITQDVKSKSRKKFSFLNLFKKKESAKNDSDLFSEKINITDDQFAPADFESIFGEDTNKLEDVIKTRMFLKIVLLI